MTDIVAESLAFDNARGETIRARLFAPVVDQALPGVVVLHGSGGLFRQLSAGETTSNDPCSDEMEPQFVEWADILPREGYVTIMPASFASRGFCDYNQDPHPGFDDPARLAARTFDLYGALDTLCADGRVLCDRLGVLGFSNGGSVTVLGLHEALDAVAELAGLPARRPTARVGIAYYPGCGLNGFITLSEDPTRVDDFYMPFSPVWVHHAELDSLLDNCQLRDRQVTAVSQARSVPDPFDLRVFAGADHGFDSTPANAAEEDAKSTARRLTLEHLRVALFGG